MKSVLFFPSKNVIKTSFMKSRNTNEFGYDKDFTNVRGLNNSNKLKINLKLSEILRSSFLFKQLFTSQNSNNRRFRSKNINFPLKFM